MMFDLPTPQLFIPPHPDLHNILTTQAALYPEKIYIYNQEGGITYQQMSNLSIRLARQLHQHLDTPPTPILAVSLTNSHAILRLVWACLAAGVCLAFLPLNPDPEQTTSLMTQVKATVLVTDIPELQNVPGAISYEMLQEGYEETASRNGFVVPRLESPAFLFQTSGTTGASKWVQVTHHHYLTAVSSMRTSGALDHAINQTVYITAPLSHSYGLSSLLEYTSVGASIILPASRSALGAITDLMNPQFASRVTALEGVPHFYAQMARLIKRVQLPALQHIGLGGGALEREVMTRIGESYPQVSYSVRYGLTETPSVVSHKLFTPPYADDWRSSGKVLPGYTLQIVDERGELVPAGQPGEIHIRGESLAWPYYGETAVSDFFPTGDIGYIHRDTQELYIVGRHSLFLKVRGYRISPETIESAIRNFPNILDCRVSGTEIGILAEVVPTDHSVSPQTLLKFLATRLPDYAIPETVTFVTSIPRTHSGKIIRY